MVALKYILLLLGIFEIISNTIHLSKKSIDEIGNSAKKQHREIPLDLPNIYFYYKAIIMFIFGLLFLIAGLFVFLDVSFAVTIVWIVIIGFGLYGLVQAVLYKNNIRVWSAMVVYNIPLLINIFF